MPYTRVFSNRLLSLRVSFQKDTWGIHVVDFGALSNALNSPWVLDDFTEIVGEVGDKLDVVMVPKVEGVWDIHYCDQLLAQLEARYGVKMIGQHFANPQAVTLEASDGRGTLTDADIAEPWRAPRAKGPV